MPRLGEISPNSFKIRKDCVVIDLTRGRTSCIDIDDWSRVSKYRWWLVNCRGKTYAQTRLSPDKTSILLHNFILGFKGIDHKDGDGLNNRKQNLRPATQAQQCWNRKKQKATSCPWRGVSIRTGRRGQKTFRAQIQTVSGKKSLGDFLCGEEAARAYDAAAKISFGEFARLNFPSV